MAHPRVSGENADTLTWGSLAAGSSPRERGKRVLGYLWQYFTGLIPA